MLISGQNRYYKLALNSCDTFKLVSMGMSRKRDAMSVHQMEIKKKKEEEKEEEENEKKNTTATNEEKGKEKLNNRKY